MTDLELTPTPIDFDADRDTPWPSPGTIRCEQIHLTPDMRELLMCKGDVCIPGYDPLPTRSALRRLWDGFVRAVIGGESV